MKKLSEKTKRLLRLTRASILADKCAYDQGKWGGNDRKQSYPGCGSEACLIGWMVFHAISRLKARQKRRAWKRYIKVAYEHGASSYFDSPWVEKMLGLSNGQLNQLYWKDRWPEEYQHHADEDAKNAGKRITHFIKTEGRD